MGSMIIAIDGPAASGKGTVAKRVAAYLGLSCLDTGLLYRAVARDVMERGVSLENEPAAVQIARTLDMATLDDPGLRLAAIGDAASIVARMPGVRAALLNLQRDFAAQEPGAVLDGRDIGTVVCPDADVKLFITADVEVRARRRHAEQEARGEPVTFEAVRDTIKTRDARDAGRADAPMKIADDAVLIDTTGMDVEAAVAAALAVVARKIG